jgi:DNA-binding NarL/FixJ family response regulator
VIRVLIADDEALVRGGFRMILEAQADLQVVGEAADGQQALARARELAPDVVLMDIRMPVMDGLEATRRLLSSSPTPPKVVMLTTFDLDQYVYEAMKVGASGFLLKTAPPSELAAAVRAVVGGEVLLAPPITRRLVEQFGPPPGRWTPGLCGRGRW